MRHGTRLRCLLLLAWLAALLGCQSRPPIPGVGQEPPGAERVVIEGHERVSREDLLSAAARELKDIRDPVRGPGAADDAAWAMERLLQERGFSEARVELDASGERFVYSVEEGPRVILAGVELHGVRCLDEAALLEYFEWEGPCALGTGPQLFDERRIEDAIAAVEREYQLAGFRDVEVAEPDVTEGEDGRRHVRIYISEGRKYCIGGVEVEGAGRCAIDMRREAFTPRSRSIAEGRVRTSLLRRGHQFAKVTSRADVDEERACARLHVAADPGPRVRLRCVRFKGLCRTRRAFARSLVPLDRGDVLSQCGIDDGVSRLFRAGIFSTVDPHVERVGDAEADLVMEVPERENRSIDIEAGWGAYERARGALRFSDRNALGIGRRFDAELRGHTRGGEFLIDWVDPWILGPCSELTLEFGVGSREYPTFTEEALFFSVAAQTRVNDDLTLVGGYRFRSENAFDVVGSGVESTGEDFLNATGPFVGFRYDTRDSPLLPASGTYARGDVFWSARDLGADVEYIEVEGSVEHYQSLGSVVLALSASFETRDDRGAPGTLPIQYRYFLGGAEDVRSFDEDELAPTDASGTAVGGLTALHAHAELRFPLGLGDLHGAAFYDVGLVSRRAWDLDAPLGHAVGLGLRYYFPFGPVRIDYAYGPGERFAADSRHAVHVGFGFGW